MARSGSSWDRQRRTSSEYLLLRAYFGGLYNVMNASNRDKEQTMKLFEKYKPTHVIHLAALGTFHIFRP